MTGLGLRLTFTANRVRLAMMIGGVAVAVALLLGMTGALPAAVERLAKTAGRGVDLESPLRAEGVRTRLSVGLWRGQQVRVLLVELVGPDVPPPPGVPHTPRAGEVFASPALGRALAGEHGGELAPRLPGRVVGTVARDGLVGPGELYAVAGVGAGELGGVGMTEGYAQGFAKPAGGLLASQAAYVDGTGMRHSKHPVEALPIVLGLAAVGLITPLLVLVGTSTRLSAASRERRVGAMRLVGATPRQLRRLGAVEGAVVGALGTVAGLALFFLVRAPAAAAIPIRDGLYAGDVAPPLAAVLAVLAGVPLLTAAAGVLALRRAVSAPLFARRRAGRPAAGPLRLAPLGAGLLLLAAAYADRGALATGTKALLFGGGAMCLVGIAVGAAALSRLAGALLARWGPGLGSQFAGRRLLTDPAGAARTITGTALVVVVVGWVLAFLPILAPAGSGGNSHLAGVLPDRTVIVTLAGDSDVDSAAATLRAVPGVTVTAAFRSVTLHAPGGGEGVSAVVGDCTGLAAVLDSALPGCLPDTIYRLPSSTFDAETLAATGRLQPVAETEERPDPAAPTVRVPSTVDTVDLPEGLTQDVSFGFTIWGDLLVPPALLAGWDAPGRWFPTLLVATDGRPDTVEAVRTGLGSTPMALPSTTPGEAVELARSASDGYRQAALIAALTVVLTGGLSLAVTTADAVRERHRAHAALTAMGTPARLLRRGVLLHTALPLLLNVGLALLVTAATSWLYLRVTTDPVATGIRLPWAGYAAIGFTALAASLLATAAALPFVRAATRPDALRTE